MTATTSRSRARDIATRLASMLQGYLSGKLAEEALVKALRKLALDLEAAPVLKPAPAQQPEQTALVQRVFEHWQTRMNMPRAKLTTGRRDKIRSRVREGYTEQQLKRAIDACAANDFYMGQNDRSQAYNDLTLIFRNGEKLEAFLAMASEQDPRQAESSEIRSIQREAEAALASGDMDAYNRANARLRAARCAPAADAQCGDPGAAATG